mgnify:CR=1 FL=1
MLAGVVGVEDGADGLGLGALGIGQGVVAAVEGLQIEVLLDRLGGQTRSLLTVSPA